MTKPVFDLSFGWPTITGDKILRAGAAGVIGYAGCLRTDKNVSKARFQDWLDSGLMVGLVVEDYAGDAIRGAVVGREQGKRIADAAASLGYDVANCVLSGGYDTDAHGGDYGHLADYMHAFAQEVPVPGYYGDSDSIDYLHGHGGADWFFWQSSSASFSPRNPTPNAHLHQQYADPRSHGLDVDVNDVLKTPLRLMGEEMPLSEDDITKLVTRFKQADIGDETIASAARETHDMVAALQKQVAALQAVVSTIKVGGVDAAAVAKELAAHLDLKMVAK